MSIVENRKFCETSKDTSDFSQSDSKNVRDKFVDEWIGQPKKYNNENSKEGICVSFFLHNVKEKFEDLLKKPADIHTVPATSKIDEKDFPKAAKELLEKLDSGHKGYVTKRELAAAMQDPSIKGQNAQVLGSLYSAYAELCKLAHDTKDGEKGISSADIDCYGEMQRNLKTVDKAPKAVEIVNASLLWISGSQQGDTCRDLYKNSARPKESITPDALQQASIGDCYLLANLASMAKNNPEKIDNMIRQDADRNYVVKFPGDPEQREYHIKAPTEAEMGLYNHGSQYGVWPLVIEKAWGRYREFNGQSQVPEAPAAGADGGGDPNEAARILTGKAVDDYSMDLKDSELVEKIKDACEGDPPVCITASTPGVSDKDPTKHGLAANHCYMVQGLKSDGRGGYLVILRNPWGGPNAVQEVSLKVFKADVEKMTIQQR